MSLVRYANLCDTCGKRSAEYTTYPDCFECVQEFCPNCGVVTQECDGEIRERGYCNTCIGQLKAEQQRIAEILEKVKENQ